jgi:hypothetical protein
MERPQAAEEVALAQWPVDEDAHLTGEDDLGERRARDLGEGRAHPVEKVLVGPRRDEPELIGWRHWFAFHSSRGELEGTAHELPDPLG